jgi:hypothetical protein
MRDFPKRMTWLPFLCGRSPTSVRPVPVGVDVGAAHSHIANARTAGPFCGIADMDDN